MVSGAVLKGVERDLGAAVLCTMYNMVGVVHVLS
jgi:hypothetical protein